MADSTGSDEVIYFIGCDMGGWHTKKGDAVAACKWQGGTFHHLEAVAGSLFHPVPENGSAAKLIQRILTEDARLIVAIDAALAWPVRFADLVRDAPTGKHDIAFQPDAVIDNPYLYRDTERYIKRHVLIGPKERPLTAPGDKFGNNSSKAQALVAWLKRTIPDLYRPPFAPDDKWDHDTALMKRRTLIEVYPAASMKSKPFKKITWPHHEQSMADLGNSDIADAKRCAMTAACYAAMLGLIPESQNLPPVVPPPDAKADPTCASVEQEGWIFSPARG